MKKEKLLQECKATLESLIEKTKFTYSEKFFQLDDFEKQKYQKDKMATETHLSTLCNILWGEKTSTGMGGVYNLFALGLIGGMFGGLNPSSNTNCFNKELEKVKKEPKKKETSK